MRYFRWSFLILFLASFIVGIAGCQKESPRGIPNEVRSHKELPVYEVGISLDPVLPINESRWLEISIQPLIDLPNLSATLVLNSDILATLDLPPGITMPQAVQGTNESIGGRFSRPRLIIITLFKNKRVSAGELMSFRLNVKGISVGTDGVVLNIRDEASNGMPSFERVFTVTYSVQKYPLSILQLSGSEERGRPKMKIFRR